MAESATTDGDPIVAKFFGYFEDEWKVFTKTQRRIITLMISKKKDGFTDKEIKLEVRKVLEISPSCLRTHLFNIRTKAHEIKRKRALDGKSTDELL
tara:strand:+ start:388 stop:675 length:288 start_codon:yes stop_codon:yes gene_type:complete